MIKSDDNTENPTDRADARSAKCWHREPNTPAVRFETSDGEIFVFPYQHLSFIRLHVSSDGDCLIVAFSTHEVTIEGKKLITVLKAFQDFAAEWLKPLPSRFATLSTEDSAIVTEIVVRPLQNSEEN